MSQIFHGDALKVLPTFPEGCVDAVITSPRYNFGKNYPGVPDNTPMAVYMDEMQELGKALHRVLQPEGVLFLNVGTRAADPLHDVEVCQRFLQAGWICQERIVWQKATEDGRGHFTPINSNCYLNNLWESIFVLTKTGRIPLDRLAIGVPYTDTSNIKRWKSGKAVHCRGDVWHVPPGVGPEDARWLALLVDTEGSITINVNNSRIEGRSPSHVGVVSISNCSLKLLEIAQKIAGAGRIDEAPDPTPTALIQGNHQVYRLVFASTEASTVLARIYPWLIVKQRQAAAVLHLEGLKQIRDVPTRQRLSADELQVRERVCDVIRSLNRREDPDDAWIPTPDLVNEGGDIFFIPYDTIQNRARDRKGHEATFPRELVIRCLRLIEWGKKGLRVLDPCCGTGTVPIVAVEQGHIGVGIDLSPEMAQEAANALTEAKPACEEPA